MHRMGITKMNKTKIEYCDATINPIVGCSKCSPGCDNCYAERMAVGRKKVSAVRVPRFCGQGSPLLRSGFPAFLLFLMIRDWVEGLGFLEKED